MKVGLEAMTPIQIATMRVLTGMVVVLALLAMTGGRLPTTWRVWRHMIVIGFFLSAFPFTLFAISETRVSSALAGIGNSTTPIATVLATMVLIPNARTSTRKIVAVLIGFVGVILIAQPWTVAERPDLLGFAMAVVGGASYGVGWTYYHRFLSGADLGGLSQPAAVLVVGAGSLVPASLVVWWLTGGAPGDSLGDSRGCRWVPGLVAAAGRHRARRAGDRAGVHVPVRRGAGRRAGRRVDHHLSHPDRVRPARHPLSSASTQLVGRGRLRRGAGRGAGDQRAERRAESEPVASAWRTTSASRWTTSR
ncbi:MAG: DMT family transporter [Actinomycetales bacterium]|uniref:DMT family transporter n=1 Tax=Candidatus Phosphoribacter hodrii TaxID=2953743 RepID=A0A9D7Y0Q0_9MICO|nr:DMT family transporter [Candidatus Phosphoribacter hodrii]